MLSFPFKHWLTWNIFLFLTVTTNTFWYQATPAGPVSAEQRELSKNTRHYFYTWRKLFFSQMASQSVCSDSGELFGGFLTYLGLQMKSTALRPSPLCPAFPFSERSLLSCLPQPTAAPARSPPAPAVKHHSSRTSLCVTLRTSKTWKQLKFLVKSYFLSLSSTDTWASEFPRSVPFSFCHRGRGEPSPQLRCHTQTNGSVREVPPQQAACGNTAEQPGGVTVTRNRRTDREVVQAIILI